MNRCCRHLLTSGLLWFDVIDKSECNSYDEDKLRQILARTIISAKFLVLNKEDFTDRSGDRIKES